METFSGRRAVRWHMRRATLVAVTMLALAWGVPAAVYAQTPVGSVALSDAEAAMLKENPALAELAEASPQLLRDVLDRLARAIANPTGARGGLEQLTEEDLNLLEQNPALFQAWRSSPEASADLLELIRVAAGGKPRK
jgi:hypothetical protein